MYKLSTEKGSKEISELYDWLNRSRCWSHPIYIH